MTHDLELLDTQRAFDSVAADYDGQAGNNALVAHMRAALWRTVLARVPRGARLLDLGCGTGIDAAYFAAQGYDVVATDWSPQMAARAQARIAGAGLSERVQVAPIGVQELRRLQAPPFDAIYSDLGPLNCAPDLSAAAKTCAALLKPHGELIVSLIGRVCPWEFVYFAARGQWRRATVRAARGPAAVRLNGQTVWTRYYTPREFYRAFAGGFSLVQYRALNLFLPPPYLIGFYERAPRVNALLRRLDARLDGLPLLRDAGDHFLMVLQKRG